MPNTFKMVPKWQNFAKLGHTGLPNDRLAKLNFREFNLSRRPQPSLVWKPEDVRSHLLVTVLWFLMPPALLWKLSAHLSSNFTRQTGLAGWLVGGWGGEKMVILSILLCWRDIIEKGKSMQHKWNHIKWQSLNLDYSPKIFFFSLKKFRAWVRIPAKRTVNWCSKVKCDDHFIIQAP